MVWTADQIDRIIATAQAAKAELGPTEPMTRSERNIAKARLARLRDEVRYHTDHGNEICPELQAEVAHLETLLA